MENKVAVSRIDNGMESRWGNLPDEKAATGMRFTNNTAVFDPNS